MKPYVWLFLLILALVETYSLLPSHTPNSKSEFAPADLPFRNYVTGAVHVPTQYSTGSGSVPQIAEAANAAQLDFVVVTDLDSTRARREGFEHRFGNTDLFVEMEALTPGGHCLVFHSHTEARDLSDNKIAQLAWSHFLGRESVPGIFTVVSHPSNLKHPWNRFDRFPDGVEVINFDSSWRRQLDNSPLNFATTLLSFPFNNYLAGMRFATPYKKDFTSWDAMNTASPGRFGILAHNTEAKVKVLPGVSVPWPGYLQSFKYAANVVFYDPPLADEFAARRAQIYQSIKGGRSAMVYQFIHPFEGNDFYLDCGDQPGRSGDTVKVADRKCHFVVKTPPKIPYPPHFLLWRGGELVKEFAATGDSTSVPVSGPGVYRLEVWLRARSQFHALVGADVPYVFYNPIYIK